MVATNRQQIQNRGVDGNYFVMFFLNHATNSKKFKLIIYKTKAVALIRFCFRLQIWRSARPSCLAPVAAHSRGGELACHVLERHASLFIRPLRGRIRRAFLLSLSSEYNGVVWLDCSGCLALAGTKTKISVNQYIFDPSVSHSLARSNSQHKVRKLCGI